MASNYPTSILPSATEIKNRRLTPQNLEIAIRSLYHDGLVVIENVVPHAALDRLNEKIVRDAYTLQSRKENSPYNYNRGNIQQDPPPVKDYFDPDIFLSKCRAPRRDQILLTVSSQTQLLRRYRPLP
jgi:nitrite reductase/ring-hydroxylating ferredoxin subunit